MLSFRLKGGVLLGGGAGVRRMLRNRNNQRVVNSYVGESVPLIRFVTEGCYT